MQFKAHQLKTTLPNSLEGIERYLGSGLIKGIGPHFAKKLIKTFGEEVFNVIENTPNRLMELEGVGKKRRDFLINSWAEQRSIRNIMVFLQSHGVGTARAVRIYKMYGDQAIDRIKTNPYCLSLDIRGIGFKTADDLAEKLGIDRQSIIRAQAGIHHVLQELCDFGHCATDYEMLITASVELLAIHENIIKQAIAQELAEENLVQDDIDGKAVIFPITFYRAELGVVEQLSRLFQGVLPWGNIDVEKAIPWVETQTNLKLSPSQQQAISFVLKQKISIITGGPGVGKTTIVDSILKILRAKKLSIALVAPTGRAAKRLTETTGVIATTIHRLLEFDAKNYGFKHNMDNPLKTDVLLVDESSMLDISLFYHLLKAIPSKAAVIFVGDVDQLPSVGAGAILSDLINSQVITTVRLTEIFRQAAHSKIIVNSHRINQGHLPLPNEEGADFFVVYENPEQIQAKLLYLVCEKIPTLGYSNKDIQVLTPMNRGGLGARSLNIELQKKLNAQSTGVHRFGSRYSVGDRVIQNVNNYDKEVFNGDIGFIQEINLEDSLLHIQFDQRLVKYDFNELDEISLAYAISIHKSQGSEFPVIVLPIAMQHFMLLAKNLVYTGITRGKCLVVIIAEKKALTMAVKNTKNVRRMTKLAARLQSKLKI